jgi:hypothetical protein
MRNRKSRQASGTPGGRDLHQVKKPATITPPMNMKAQTKAIDSGLLSTDLPSRFARRLPGHEFNLHEDQVLITAIDDVVLYSGSPEVFYASSKLGS